ncbi:MAG: hypothetical protein KME18_09345 [Phormidium tanganyikae FI6-MK23]|jgi:hypothetical protein|nr:hypothetical protein [Phormidium tanganyikae FI6-MK23]
MSKGGIGRPTDRQRWIQLQLKHAANADLEKLSAMIGHEQAIKIIDDYQSKLADSETKRKWFEWRATN